MTEYSAEHVRQLRRDRDQLRAALEQVTGSAGAWLASSDDLAAHALAALLPHGRRHLRCTGRVAWCRAAVRE